MARNNRNSRNNNPEGRNQYSGGWVDTAKDRPMATAAAAAAAVGAGVFLWSRRNQISDQITHLSDQISDWSQSFRSSQDEMAMAGEDSAFESASRNRSLAKDRDGRNSAIGLSETGGGNASLGANSGGRGKSGGTGRSTAKARRTTGRAEPQSTVM